MHAWLPYKSICELHPQTKLWFPWFHTLHLLVYCMSSSLVYCMSSSRTCDSFCSLFPHPQIKTWNRWPNPVNFASKSLFKLCPWFHPQGHYPGLGDHPLSDVYGPSCPWIYTFMSIIDIARTIFLKPISDLAATQWIFT